VSLAAHVVGREQTELKAGSRRDRQLKVSENGRLKTRAEEECGNKPRCGLYSPIHVDMDMGVRVVKRPLYGSRCGSVPSIKETSLNEVSQWKSTDRVSRLFLTTISLQR
jgi:hypothetical protein